jgi:hypothetical protein
MHSEEIEPHLNKIATLYLKNNKRKVGWIYTDDLIQARRKALEEIYFISIQKGKKLLEALEANDQKALEPYREIISLEMIERIRSSK